MGGMKAESMEQFKENVKAWFGSYADEMLALCGTDDLDKANAASTLSGIDLGVRAVQKRKEELGIDDPVYYGVFDPSIPGWDDPKTFHSSDLWFWFETLAKCWRPFKGFHYDLARNMCNYMTNFVKTGNPNGEDADGTPMPEWKPFTTADPEVIWFKDTGSECEVSPPAEITQIVQKALLEKYPL